MLQLRLMFAHLGEASAKPVDTQAACEGPLWGETEASFQQLAATCQRGNEPPRKLILPAQPSLQMAIVPAAS